jgi:hypothetical protein
VIADHLDGDYIDEGYMEPWPGGGSGRLALDARAASFQTRERRDEFLG